jgi:hypothetical protein
MSNLHRLARYNTGSRSFRQPTSNNTNPSTIWDLPKLTGIWVSSSVKSLERTLVEHQRALKFTMSPTGGKQLDPDLDSGTITPTSLSGQSRRLTACRSLPVYPHNQTYSEWLGMSQRCHNRTHAPQQLAILFTIIAPPQCRPHPSKTNSASSAGSSMCFPHE